MRFLISLCASLLLLLINGSTTTSFDPCYNYTILDEYWRDIQPNYYSLYNPSGNDSLVEWRGWYRLYLRGLSAQMSEWCVSTTHCGGETGLSLSGSHPRLEDGVVTREVVGTSAWWWLWSSSSCGSYKSNSIRVKACPGNYYVYELVKPNASIPRPMYCAVAFQNISSDPCYNYKSLDRPWRANNESEDRICDSSFSWNGWYRLFYRGMNIQLPETCVSSYRCNTQITLWLNGPHPRTEDGVVIREVCGGTYGTQCCSYKTRPIRVKACPGNYYVYELVKPDVWCAGYCTNISTISQPISTVSPSIISRTNNPLNYDPCINYNTLNDNWRNILDYGHMNGLNADYDDTGVNWDGWYRLFLNRLSAQMPEWCVSNLACGGFSSLWLGGSHPRLEDGAVTRDIYGSHYDQCSYYRSDPIQVKACPGNYYVYKFTRPPLSIPSPVYCAVRFTTPRVDPCYNYNSLNETWRATDNPYDSNYRRCDNFQGWYRLFYNGQSAQMPESCVNQYMCGTYIPMWLNGSHPRLEDGVVTRQVCGSGWSDCCYYRSLPIQVKACPGNYYVYEFVSPIFCGAYCTDVTRLSAASLTTASTPRTTTTTATASITPTVTTTESTHSSSDPCYNYTTLDEYWRDIRQSPFDSSGHNDSLVEWRGWYRLYLNGKSAQMSEWCVSRVGCGGDLGLYLNGSHPRIEDGVVTREVFGSYTGSFQCGGYTSESIQVKACLGNYYIYKLVKPNVPNYMPSYCAVAFQNISSDPCYDYESLDRPWRANNESGEFIWEESFLWNGWYRLFYYGMDIRMPETCVGSYRCNAFQSLSLSGLHPRIEDGVVVREVQTEASLSGSCVYKSKPIRVKACPGNYYVYELVDPQFWCSGYCTDVNTISMPVSTISPNVTTGSSITLNYDPCTNYNILNNNWRSTVNYWHQDGYMCEHDDTRVNWDGWYRLFINGLSAQMPEWCVSYMMCGGFAALWLGGAHPQIEDGVVTREVYGSYYDQESYYRSDPIQVKACPGNYYVYKFTRPNLSIPSPTYCAVLFTTPNVDPCYNYTTLDEPRRSTSNSHYYGMCDYNVKWNGWYRLLIRGQNAQMPESCVNQNMCGTEEPFWLNGSHPQLQDGVVTRHVCVSSWNGCCGYTSHPIQVKACPGNYYVYEFVRPMFCGVYCATTTTTTATKTTTKTASATTPRTTPPTAIIRTMATAKTKQKMTAAITIATTKTLPLPATTTATTRTPTISTVTTTALTTTEKPPTLPTATTTATTTRTISTVTTTATTSTTTEKPTPLSTGTTTATTTRTTISTVTTTPTTTETPPPLPTATTTATTRKTTISTVTTTPTTAEKPTPLPTATTTATTRKTTISTVTASTTTPLPKTTTTITTTPKTIKPTTTETPTTTVTATPTPSTSVTTTGETEPCSELSCSEDEHCGEKNGVYGCLCNRNHYRKHTDSFDFSETCESSSGSMSVSRCQLFEAGFSADILHLNDPSCKGTVRNGRVEFHFDNNEHICGTNLVANGTHFIYDNFILGTPRTEGLISREKVLKLSFSCAYPQTQTLSMNMEISSLESIVHKSLPAGEGRYRVRMIPYQDDEFTRPFTGSVDAELNQEMHVEVRVEGVDSRQFALVIDTCWATPVNDPDYTLRWDLVVQECPNPNDDTVELLQNGVSTSSRFSFRMFIFTANSTKLYLHCAVHLCLLSSNHCSPNCNSGQHWRRRRSLDFHDSSSISMGPLMLSEGNTDKWVKEKVKVSKASSLCASLMVLFVFMMSVLILF